MDLVAEDIPEASLVAAGAAMEDLEAIAWAEAEAAVVRHMAVMTVRL